MQNNGDKERGDSERGFVRLLGTVSKDYGNVYCTRKFKRVAVKTSFLIKSEFAFFQFFFSKLFQQTLSDVGVEFLRNISKIRNRKKIPRQLFTSAIN